MLITSRFKKGIGAGLIVVSMLALLSGCTVNDTVPIKTSNNSAIAANTSVTKLTLDKVAREPVKNISDRIYSIGDSVTNDGLTYTLEDVAFEKGLFQDYTCILLWSVENNDTEPKVTDRCDLYVNDTKADVNKLKGYKEFNGRKELKLNYVRPNETVQLYNSFIVSNKATDFEVDLGTGIASDAKYIYKFTN